MMELSNPEEHYKNSTAFDKYCSTLINQLTSYKNGSNLNELLLTNESTTYILDYIAYQVEHSDDIIEIPKAFDALISFCSKQKNNENLILKNYCIYLRWALELLDWSVVRKYMPNSNRHDNNSLINRFNHICNDIINMVKNNINIEIKEFDELANIILEVANDQNIFAEVLNLDSYKELVVLSNNIFNGLNENLNETELQTMSIFKVLEICHEKMNLREKCNEENLLSKKYILQKVYNNGLDTNIDIISKEDRELVNQLAADGYLGARQTNFQLPYGYAYCLSSKGLYVLYNMSLTKEANKLVKK